MHAIMSQYFLSERHKRTYVLFINEEYDFKHISINIIHVNHLNHEVDNHLEMKCSTLHSTAAIIAQHFSYELVKPQKTQYKHAKYDHPI